MRANPYSNPLGLRDYEVRAMERYDIRGRMQQGVRIVAERDDWVRTKNKDDDEEEGERGVHISWGC